MYKIIFAVLLTVSTGVMADTCAGGAGDLLTGNTKGTYCLSHTTMNWWSAHAWCQSIGAELVDLTEDCVPDNNSTVACPNLYNNGVQKESWTSNVPSSTQAYYISHSTGGVSKVSSHRDGGRYALCRMKTSVN